MAVLGSLALPAVMAGFRVAGLRSLEWKTLGLIRDMNETLGSTAALAANTLARREFDVAAVCRRMRLFWAERRPTGELLMTAPHARQSEVLPRPACTPTVIRAVLAANADGDTLQRYDEDLDAAYEQAREQGDVTPLVQTVKRWWFEADAWRDPQAQQEFPARIAAYRDDGPPPAEQRMSREEIRAQFGV